MEQNECDVSNVTTNVYIRPFAKKYSFSYSCNWQQASSVDWSPCLKQNSVHQVLIKLHHDQVFRCSNSMQQLSTWSSIYLQLFQTAHLNQTPKSKEIKILLQKLNIVLHGYFVKITKLSVTIKQFNTGICYCG